MSIFSQRTAANTMSERDMLTSKYTTSRMNLLMVVAFTAVNLILCISNSGNYFLFSAYIPYFLGDLGLYSCNMYPDEWYSADFPKLEYPFPSAFFYTLVALAVAIIIVYLLCFIFSKKHVGWIIASLVLFGLDTAFLLFNLGFDFSMILDYLFHAWVIYYLVNAIIVHNKLKKLPEEIPEAEVAVAAEAVSAEPAGEPVEETVQEPVAETAEADAE